MRTIRILRAVLIRAVLLMLALAFILWVWPTRFRYDHLSTEGNTYPVRIDRLSGDADMLVPDEGWVPVEGTEGNGNEAAPTRARHPLRLRLASHARLRLP